MCERACVFVCLCVSTLRVCARSCVCACVCLDSPCINALYRKPALRADAVSDVAIPLINHHLEC